MTTVATSISPPKGIHNGVEFLQTLGDVPIDRVVFDPWPGFATELDLAERIESRRECHCELIDGTFVEKTVGHYEAFIAGLISTFLNQYVRPRKAGFVFTSDGMMRTRPGRVRLPDVSFIRAERITLPGREWPAIFDGSPDLVVEIISAGNSKAEMREKSIEHSASDTSLVRYVYPKEQTACVYTSAEQSPLVLTMADDLTGGNLLPGFCLRLAELFSEQP